MRNIARMFQHGSEGHLKIITQIICSHVTNMIEDTFPAKVTADAGKNELNSIIGNGIYNALFALTHVEEDRSVLEVFKGPNRNPDSFEGLVLEPHLAEVEQRLKSREASFESPFLQDLLQHKILEYNPQTNCVSVFLPYEFDFSEFKGRRAFMAKIRFHLKQEGYSYDPCTDGYVKVPDWLKNVSF